MEVLCWLGEGSSAYLQNEKKVFLCTLDNIG